MRTGGGRHRLRAPAADRYRRVQYRSVGADSAADWRRANAGAKFAISSVSFLRQNSTQGCLAVPSDISDPPTHAELDEVENNGALLARIFEWNGRARLVGGNFTDVDIDGVDLPILRIDEGIGVELPDLAARILAVLDDERRELGREIAPHRRAVVERNSIRVFAFVGGIDGFHKRLGGRFRRQHASGTEGGANQESHEDVASRDHDGSLHSRKRIFPRWRESVNSTHRLPVRPLLQARRHAFTVLSRVAIRGPT